MDFGGALLAAFIAASAADGVTTHMALHTQPWTENGRIYSLNEVGLAKHPWAVIGVKAGAAGVTVLWTTANKTHHPTAVKVVLIVGAAAYTGIAVHNYKLYQRATANR